MNELNASIALAVLTVVFLCWFWFAPGGVLALRRRAGGELQVDVRLAYSPGTLYRLLDAYGDEGRRMFRRMLHADMIFPAVYGATLFLWGEMLASSPHSAMPALLA